LSTLLYTKRNTLGITSKEEKEIIAKVPVNTHVEVIEEKIQKRAPWIIKQQNYYLTFHPKSNQKK